MSYTISLTDGNVFATIADGTINNSSSMTLVGKNYAGYGQFLDTNFIHLLENSSNTIAPGSPLTGQLWWDSGNGLLKVCYDGTNFKNISAATSGSTAPSGSSSVIGDLWYDTTNQQLNVYTGTAWLLVGPQATSGQGTSGAIVATITDNNTVNHVVVELWVNNSIVGMISKDAFFVPGTSVTGGWGIQTIYPGITLATNVGGQVPLFNGTATIAQTLLGYNANAFMKTGSNTSTTGTLSVLNNSGLYVGQNSDFNVSVNANTSSVTLRNQTTNANLNIGVNVGGSPTNSIIIDGSTGTVTIPSLSFSAFGNITVGNIINENANGVGNIGSSTNYFNTIFARATSAEYADVAERFHADEVYAPGTVVELGGLAEITRSVEELSDSVFGVISTRAAYLMNSAAGDDLTHPPVAMTGRVPVRVTGQVRKGDRLVSAGQGVARAAKTGEATAFNVIGRALKDKLDSNEGIVEAIVTIK
jgi:hypothetical protein